LQILALILKHPSTRAANQSTPRARQARQSRNTTFFTFMPPPKAVEKVYLLIPSLNHSQKTRRLQNVDMTRSPNLNCSRISLRTTYGTDTPKALESNTANMNKAWTRNKPIEELISQLRIANAFAEDKEPILDTLQ
jgi:hypothetical protein